MKTIKLLLTTIAVLLCSVMANAYDFEVDGMYYNIISSTDLTVEVTSGDNKYTGDLVIPYTVNYKSRVLTITVIGSAAFSGCDSLNFITIPNSVIAIESDAFSNCTSLTSITIPNSVTSIGSYAFSGCESLNSITIPNSVIAIESGTFSGCTSLTSFTIPNSVTDIGNGAFNECSSLNELRIEDGNTNLKMGYSFRSLERDYSKDRYNYYYYGLFHDCPLEILHVGRNLDFETEDRYVDYPDSYEYYCSPFYRKKLKSVTFGNLVTTIREELFNECSVKKITIPKNVTSIENGAFERCSLRELYIEDGGAALVLGNSKEYEFSGNTYFYEGLFEGCGLDSLYIGRNLTYKIEREGGSNKYYYPPFYNSRTLKSVTIGDSVTVIGEQLFYNCEKLTYAIIGNNVTEIGMKAFYSCDSLRSITIPSSVVEIGDNAFSSCQSLKYLYIEDSPKELSGNYKTFGYCSFKEVYLGRNLLTVQFVDIDSLTIGSNVTKIGKIMFSGGANISSIYSMCTNPPAIESGNDFTESQYVYTTVLVPKGALSAYQTAEIWKNFWDIQEYCLDKKFCVNYYIDEELYAVDSVKHGDIITLRAEPTKEGYTFSGWSEVPETMPAHDVEVYGNFFLLSDVDNLEFPSQKKQKVIENDQLVIILPNGKKYNIMGQEI